MKSRPIKNMFVVIKPHNNIIILAIYIKVSLGCVNLTQPSYAEVVCELFSFPSFAELHFTFHKFTEMIASKTIRANMMTLSLVFTCSSYYTILHELE